MSTAAFGSGRHSGFAGVFAGSILLALAGFVSRANGDYDWQGPVSARTQCYAKESWWYSGSGSSTPASRTDTTVAL